jgi:peptidoglycan hydrolase-like protein with peptidoglycan-binding domain
MKRFLAVMLTVALSAALTAPATADTAGQKVDRAVQKTKDAAEKVGDKAKDVKERMLGRKSEGPEDHHGAVKSQEVMAAQQALKEKGHDPGKIDGKMGPRTRAMLSDYQKAEGLKITGQLDNDTRGKLGM